jgi:hypothetical protein
VSAAVAVLAVLLAACAQVTVAPLFPLGAAIVSFPLVTIVLAAAFGGPRMAMIAIPAGAIAEAFLSGGTLALLFLSYVPLLPAALALESAIPVVLTPSVRFAMLLAAGSVWTRLAAGATIFALGASFEPFVLVFDIILPGLVLDLALFGVWYGAGRLLRLPPRSMVLNGALAV